MAANAVYVGIDLGTSNSAAAVFDGEKVEVVRNAQGAVLTPSVVRLDAKGNATVGAKARRAMETDPVNVRSEFKRLMGTKQALEFPAAKVSKRPEELSALVLSALRNDVKDMCGVLPERAVISVPALFEVPQANATSEAARLAGFTQVELIQEPVASALAAGWSADDTSGHWLVYDLGGGTFDVSLLETREGLLRVVAHDGDNFLGGRDFDQAIVDHLLAELSKTSGISLDRGDPRLAVPLRKLKLAVEDAKIELTRAAETSLLLPGLFDLDGNVIDVDTTLTRETVEGLCVPLVDRSIEICRRLLAVNGLEPSQLTRVLLVGGPTVMPMVRERVATHLHDTAGNSLDPMTVVARGAALFAGTSGLEARASNAAAVAETGRKLWIQAPTMTSDLYPHVVGRVVEGEGAAPASIRVVRADGGFSSPFEDLDDEGGFVVTLELLPRRQNLFTLEGRDKAGKPVPVQPRAFQVVHGLTISDPPLSRSIGVARANDTVQLYLERGSPLPLRRVFPLVSAVSLVPGTGEKLRIPIVQGEFGEAHLCRLIGTLEIEADQLKATLPVGAHVDVTLELDRGGQLAARAFVPLTNQLFERVAHLSVAVEDAASLATSAGALLARVTAARQAALGTDDLPRVLQLNELLRRLTEVDRDVAASKGGDHDAGQKAQRTLQDVEAKLDALDADSHWDELLAKSDRALRFANSEVAEWGNASERRLLDAATEALERAKRAHLAEEVERQTTAIWRIGNGAYFRNPEAWPNEFQWLASRLDRVADQRQATKLVDDGKKALERNDVDALKAATVGLRRLLPPDDDDRRKAYDSGVW